VSRGSRPPVAWRVACSSSTSEVQALDHDRAVGVDQVTGELVQAVMSNVRDSGVLPAELTSDLTPALGWIALRSVGGTRPAAASKLTVQSAQSALRSQERCRVRDQPAVREHGQVTDANVYTNDGSRPARGGGRPRRGWHRW
jgi:hypothetical protein